MLVSQLARILPDDIAGRRSPSSGDNEDRGMLSGLSVAAGACLSRLVLSVATSGEAAVAPLRERK